MKKESILIKDVDKELQDKSLLENSSIEKTEENDIRFSDLEKKEASLQLSDLLVDKKISKADALRFSSLLVKEIGKKKFKDISKKFKEAESIDAHIGTTTSDGETAHTHEYALIVINWSDYLIGVTTSTSTGDNHIHVIELSISSRIREVVAWTAFSDGTVDEDSIGDFHAHTFTANIDNIKRDSPTVWLDHRYYSEHKKDKKNKEDKDKKMKVKKASEKGVVIFESDKYCFSFYGKRQAEMALLKVCHLSESPFWYDGDIDSLRLSTLNAVSNYYPDSNIFNEVSVAEFIANNKRAFNTLSLTEKVTDCSSIILKENTKDGLNHLPFNNKYQAINSLAYVAKLSESPSWYKGTLISLVEEAVKAINKKFADLDISKYSEFYSLRFKDNSGVYFINTAAKTLEEAEHDAEVYLKECRDYEIDVLKFTSDFKGKSEFKNMGSLVFFDSKTKGIISGSSKEIKLSDKDSEGNTIIEILRTGKFNHDIYGTFVIDSSTMGEIQKNFSDNVLDRDISFDFNHEADLPASAWVRKLSTQKRNIKNNPEEVLLAHVEFTPKGEKAIREKQFRYFSSEYVDNFVDKETGEDFGVTLKGGGLTNRPWIPGMKPIELSEKRNNKSVFISN